MDDQWYAVVDARSGDAVSFTTILPDDLPDGLASVEIDHQPGAGETWDAKTRSVIPTPPSVDPVYAGEVSWYAYTNPDGLMLDVGPDETVPADAAGLGATEAHQLRMPNAETDRWDPNERAFVQRTGMRFVIENREFPVLKRQHEEIMFYRDVAANAGLSTTRLDNRLAEIEGNMRYALRVYNKAKDAGTLQAARTLLPPAKPK